MENWSATFTLLGTLLGYGISYFTSQSEKNWKKAKADISVLTDQFSLRIAVVLGDEAF